MRSEGECRYREDGDAEVVRNLGLDDAHAAFDTFANMSTVSIPRYHPAYARPFVTTLILPR